MQKGTGFDLIELSRRGCLQLAGGAFSALAARQSALAQSPNAFGLGAEVVEATLRGLNLPSTKLLSFGGGFSSPVLRAIRGREIRFRLWNKLAEPYAFYWPGLRDAPTDPRGLTPKPLEPGETRDARFTCRDAGTFSYRAFSPSQNMRGLHGMFIVEDDVAVDRDEPLVLASWPLGPDGAIQPGAPRLITVNGALKPNLPARHNERVRFRLLNASQDQMMVVRFEKHEAIVVALDGHPAEPFAARDSRIALAPGNRADVMVDMVLKRDAQAPIVVETLAGETVGAQILYISEPPKRPSLLPPVSPLPANPLPTRMDFGRAVRAELSLDPAATRVPNPRSSPQRPVKLWGSVEPLQPPGPAFGAKKGLTVMLALKNDGAAPVAVHVGGHPFRLLDSLDDGWKPYWLDTVVALPQRITRIAFVAEQAGVWPIVSQPLIGDAPAVAGWYEVT